MMSGGNPGGTGMFGVSRLMNGVAVKRTEVESANYDVITEDFLISYISISGGGNTVTLPAAANPQQIFYIKDESNSASTNNITIDVDGGGDIDFNASVTISADCGVAKVYYYGGQYFTL
jgi:hypothetical protein